MDEKALASVRIVLVKPQGPLNVGSIARVMKNMGLRQLVLVEPECDPLGSEARQMALHAVDVLEAARQVETLPEALEGCTRAIATTTRSRHQSIQLESPRAALPWLLSDSPSALIFGSEDRGLTNDQLKHAQRFVRIPSSFAYPALNLAQAVAICCYELYQSAWQLSQGDRIEPNFPLSLSPTAPIEMLEGYYQQLEALLLEIGYLYPHTAASRMGKFRLLFNRAGVSAAEIAMLRGILSQIEWAIRQGVKDEPSGEFLGGDRDSGQNQP